ncbi:MAG: HD domain-containing phosphohydrolase [Candidatus Sumerlaeota bacterium]
MTRNMSETVDRRRIQTLTDIAIGLTAEQDLDKLLTRTLRYARELSHADAGTLYLMQDGALHFRIVQNDTFGTMAGGQGEQLDLPPVGLDRSNVSACAALEGRTIRIDDVYQCEDYDFSGPRRYDASTGYRSKSMLVVPMRNKQRDVIGVLQLINALDAENGEVVAFDEDVTVLVESLASLAAVAIANAALIEQTRDLFESLIKVLAVAIDAKSPHTGNHVQRVAELNLFLARKINERTDGPFADVNFSNEDLESIRLAGWLHDVGKITTPVHIMDKATKLMGLRDGLELIAARFALMELLMERSEKSVSDQSLTLDQLHEDFHFLIECNKPEVIIDDAKRARLEKIADRTVRYCGKERPLLEERELKALEIARGTLTEEEISIMREHVDSTEKMLTQVPFRQGLSKVPLYASQHHERLNGKGYPKGLQARDIPLPSRILMIADCYEALAAKDRPYKRELPEEKVLGILSGMADKGEIDKDILKLLTEEKLHREFEKQYAAKHPEQ